MPVKCFLCEKTFDSDDFDNDLLCLEHVFTDHVDDPRYRMAPEKVCWCNESGGRGLPFSGFMAHCLYKANQTLHAMLSDKPMSAKTLAAVKQHYYDVMMGVKDAD